MGRLGLGPVFVMYNDKVLIWKWEVIIPIINSMVPVDSVKIINL